MKGYKGFNKDLQCMGFQYEVGKTFEENIEPSCCDRGFHFCENPLDVLGYYPIIDDDGNLQRYCEVEAIGDIDKEKDSEDTKACTNKIKIGVELTFEKLVKAGINFVYEHAKKSKTPGAHKRSDRSVASNTGDRSVASNTGDKGIASSLGMEGKAKAKKGNWLVLAEWIRNTKKYVYEVKEVKAVLVDGKKVKEDTLYQLVNGKLEEVSE